MSTQSVSRRSFVKGAALGTAGFAAGAAATARAAESSAADQDFDEEYDIVIVGAGLAGAAAAVTAVTEGDGQSVLLLEKGSVPGGNSPLCDNSAMYTDDVDAIEQYLKDCSGEFPPSDAMIRAYAEGFGENLDWLKSLGVSDDLMAANLLDPSLVEYQEFGSDGGHVGNVRLLNPENTDDNKYMHPFLLQYAQDNGAEYRTECAAERLVQDPETGAILGVVAGGSRIKANLGVVMACGGFENSPEYLNCYVQCPGVHPAAARLNTGDGITMCSAIGAAMWHMSGWAGAWEAPVSLEGDVPLLVGVAVARQKIKQWGITVAQNGRRYYMDFDGHNIKDLDDYDKYPTMDRHVGSRHGHMQFGGGWPNLPMPQYSWYVYDANGLANGALGTDYSSEAKNPGDPVADGWAYTADTIEELAEQAGLPADELTATVDQWNEFCEEGTDMAFYRPSGTLNPITTAPFYITKCQATCLNTDGGAARNEHCQIVDPFGEPIEGLYGAGEFGSFWGHYYQGAGNVGECLVSGRIAVRHVLRASK